MEQGGVSPGDYKDLMLFLATAGIVVPLFQRLKISPTLGFLAAGVALGPFGLGALADRAPWLSYFTVSRPEEVAQLAELGVAFLLFTIGLELSWERLRLMRRLVFGLGALQVASTTLVIALIAMAFGLGPVAAATVGLGLALSSTAVALPVLGENKRLHAPAGRAAFSVLLFQDLAVAPILIVLGVLGRGNGESGFGPQALLALGPAAAGLAVLVAAGRLVLRPMMRSVARTRSDELFIAASLFIVIAAASVAALAGLSMALGAFVAGLLLAETEFRHEVELRVEPFKGLLLGLFFVSVGIGLRLSLIVEHPLLIAGLVVALVAVKAILAYGCARAVKLPRPESLELALALAAGGEFAFVVLNEALGHALVPAAVGDSVLVAATLSMFAIPVLIAAGARYAGAAALRDEGAELGPPPEAEPLSGVLIVGFGRVGQLVGEMLSRHEITWVAIDRTPKAVGRARRDGGKVYFGDAAHPELLLRCGLMTARAVVVTMDSPEAAEAVVASARRLRPDIVIVARARDARHAGQLYMLGASNAVPETIEASLQLSEAVLVDVGVPMGFVIASIHEKRDEYRKMLNQREGFGGRRRTRDGRQE